MARKKKKLDQKNCGVSGANAHNTLVWIAEKKLVPSKFLLLLKLIFLDSWMLECN